MEFFNPIIYLFLKIAATNKTKCTSIFVKDKDIYSI